MRNARSGVHAYRDGLRPPSGATSQYLYKLLNLARTSPRQHSTITDALHPADPHSHNDGETTTTAKSELAGTTRKCWKNVRNHRLFFDEIAMQLGVRHHEDWYAIKTSDFEKMPSALSLLRHYYDNSVFKALCSVYPEVDWQPWRFPMAPRRFWADPQNHRRFFDWAAKQLRIEKQPEDWYKIQTRTINKLGGASLLRHYYEGSLFRALVAIYPELEFVPWLFSTVTKQFWADKANHRRFFDWAAEQLSIKKPEDWYGIHLKQLEQIGGGGLMNDYYGCSLYKALVAIYPEVDWKPWSFAVTPAHFWDDLANQRQFFDWLAGQVGVEKPEDWYRVSTSDVEKHGGRYLLKSRYGASLVRALSTVYPDVQWQSWRFESCLIPKHVHSNDQTKDFLEFVKRELDLKDMEDWYEVSASQIRKLGGATIIERSGGMYRALAMVYPEYRWDYERLSLKRGKRASQRWLRAVLQKLFPNEEILSDYMHSELLFNDSTERMQIDVYIPKLALAFEYHGQQHYNTVYFFGPQSNFQNRDEEKAAACRAAGVTLITIPYWWDNRIESLAATIHSVRPDLIPADIATKGAPIPVSAPWKNEKRSGPAAAAAAAVKEETLSKNTYDCNTTTATTATTTSS